MADSKPTSQSNNYTLGHDPATLSAHGARSAESVAAYLLPRIKPDDGILDVGCGPGSITLGLASRAPRGHTIGIDYASTAVEAARLAASQVEALGHVEFRQGDACALQFEDETFDIVHAHQCLIHLDNPVKALREMRRVCKKGGVIGVREADFGTFVLYPEDSTASKTFTIWSNVMRSGGSEPNAGRRLLAWAREAGFERGQSTVTATVGVYCDPEKRRFMATTWSDRLTSGEVGERAKKMGFTTTEEMREVAEAWRVWAENEDGYMSTTNTELVYVKP
jgi:ubiquinone/menaquinone biosynthesis C-methylase UbiE